MTDPGFVFLVTARPGGPILGRHATLNDAQTAAFKEAGNGRAVVIEREIDGNRSPLLHISARPPAQIVQGPSVADVEAMRGLSNGFCRLAMLAIMGLTLYSIGRTLFHVAFH